MAKYSSHVMSHIAEIVITIIRPVDYSIQVGEAKRGLNDRQPTEIR